MGESDRQAKEGDRVRVHYVCRLDDGTVFDTSEGSDPFELRIGEENMPPGFEKSIVGMSPGKHRNVTIPARDAYGLRNDDLVFRIGSGEKFDEAEIGDIVQITLPSGKSIHAIVADLSEHAVTLDANHPFAGRDLTFEIDLLDIL